MVSFDVGMASRSFSLTPDQAMVKMAQKRQ